MTKSPNLMAEFEVQFPGKSLISNKIQAVEKRNYENDL